MNNIKLKKLLNQIQYKMMQNSSSNLQAQFPPHILKHLSDRNQQKREQADRQLQTIIAKNLQKKNISQIQRIITLFQDNYLKSSNPNSKKTGLQVFKSIASGFKNHDQQAARIIPKLVLPILDCFSDTEQKIRFNSIKNLYYVCGAMGSVCMVVFNDIFEQLISKVADFDEDVKKAAAQLNTTLKTIVTGALPNNRTFDLRRFMRILTDKMKAINPHIRRFLIDWITTMDDIPSVNLLVYLPSFLEDLMIMLGDKQKQVKVQAQKCLDNFMDDLKKQFRQGKLQIILSEDIISDIITILIKVCKDRLSSYTKLIAISWFQQIFQMFKQQLLNPTRIKHKFYLKKVIIQRFDEILEPILVLLSHQEEDVRKAATLNNQLLLNIMNNKKDQPINFNKVIPLLKEMLSQKKASPTSDCVLTWMKFLLQNYNDKILPEIHDIIQKLVQKLCQGNTKNVMGIIQNVSFTEQYFDLVIDKMLNIIYTKGPDLKIEHIFRKFCNLLNVEKTYMSICQQVVLVYKDHRFIDQIVHVLNYILVTYENTSVIRKRLRNLQEPANQELFKTLFKAFCYNPVCLICLCFLSEQYQIAYRVLLLYSFQRETTPAVLMQFCKLVNLLQSPNFIYLRVQMLQKNKYPYLMECIYALMMIIPQGKVFESLKNRVDIINHVETFDMRQVKEARRDLDFYVNKYREVLRVIPQ